jgi:1,4-dihydroxy-2-naphthoate octaprenyltransferase
MIGLAYGPWMVLGSAYLHLQALPGPLVWASLVPAGLIMALAVVNAIPDFHQDRLVGKRNLVQRVGRDRAVLLYVALAGVGLAVVPIGVLLGTFPPACLLALLALPWIVASARHARRTFTAPKQFLPAMRHMVVAYLVGAGLLVAGIASIASPRPCWSRGNSRATATSPACTAARIRRPASGCATSWTPTKPCVWPARSRRPACRT